MKTTFIGCLRKRLESNLQSQKVVINASIETTIVVINDRDKSNLTMMINFISLLVVLTDEHNVKTLFYNTDIWSSSSVIALLLVTNHEQVYTIVSKRHMQIKNYKSSQSIHL